MSPQERQFLTVLPQIERIIAFVSRRYRLSSDEAEEFAAHVKLKLIEDEYAVFRKFEGRSNIGTYLTTVISRLLLDFRNSAWGKWRPSAEARRAGPVAVILERLLTREGHSLEEASGILAARHGVRLEDAELNRLASRFPRRTSRRVESVDEFPEIPVADAVVDWGFVELERRRVRGALRDAISELDAQDRLILALRFQDGRKVSEIADILGLEAKPLYPRIERTLRSLRQIFERQGIDSSVLNFLVDS